MSRPKSPADDPQKREFAEPVKSTQFSRKSSAVFQISNMFPPTRTSPIDTLNDNYEPQDTEYLKTRVKPIIREKYRPHPNGSIYSQKSSIMMDMRNSPTNRSANSSTSATALHPSYSTMAIQDRSYHQKKYIDSLNRMENKPIPYPERQLREELKPEEESIETSVMRLLGRDLQNEPSQSYKDLKQKTGVLGRTIGRDVTFEDDVVRRYPNPPFQYERPRE